MKKVNMILAIIALLLPVSGICSERHAANLGEVSFNGYRSCIVYLAESGDKNFGVLCDGESILRLDAPSRKILGAVSFEGFKKAYTDFMNSKCSAAGLNGRTLIDNETFWGIICHE